MPKQEAWTVRRQWKRASNSPVKIRKFNPLHCGEGGLFIPLALGLVFLNCPLPTHLQLTLSRLRVKITRWEVYKSDLLTYSRRVQIRPSHIFTFHTHVYNRRRFQQPSGISGSQSHEGCINEQSAATFVPEVDPLTRRSWSSNSRFWAALRHLRPDEGDILRRRRFWCLSLCFWAGIRHLRPTEVDILRTEGHGLWACASWCSSDTFGYAWLHLVGALRTG